jgi:hypothetical protein
MQKPFYDLQVVRLWNKLIEEYSGEQLAIVFAREVLKLHE